MLYDEATIRLVASTLSNHYGEKALRLVCDPVCVSTSGHTLLVSSALGSLIDEVLPLATLITPNKFEAELILSHKRKCAKICCLADMVSATKELLTLGPKAVLLKGGHVTTTMTEVRELLGKNPAISVYKYGLLDENMNILQVGLGEEDRTSQLVVDVLQDSSGPGGDVRASVFIRPRIVSTSTHGTGCTLSAAITCGIANGLTSNLPLFLLFFGTDHDLFSFRGCSRRNDFYVPRNSPRFLCRCWTRSTEPRPLAGFEICASVHLSVFRAPGALK